MTIACFWLEPTERVSRALRRYTYSSEKPCPNHATGHWSVAVPFDEAPARWSLRADGDRIRRYVDDQSELAPAHDDARWPTTCPHCDYRFVEDDAWSFDIDLIYRRADTGEHVHLRDAPAGAMWDAFWMADFAEGPDGICLAVQTPGGPWQVDGPANNCSDPEGFKAGKHKCWTRVGDPRNPPSLSVGKMPGLATCAAGAGSIQAGAYHGFLSRGMLT
jgi:hypothetical protein